MVGKHDVIVLGVGDVLSAGLTERNVPVGVSAEWSLGQIEPANATVRKGANDVSGIVCASVPNYQKLEIFFGLPEHRLDCIAQHVGAVVRR